MFSGVPFLWTDRLVILTRPVFHTSYICLVSLLALAGIEWTSDLPWTDRLASVSRPVFGHKPGSFGTFIV